MGGVLRYIILFIFLVLFQCLVVNWVEFGSFSKYFSINIYIMFILVFPPAYSKYVLLIVSFLLGLSVDMFCDSPGIHASACALIAFCRPVVISSLVSNDELEKINEFNIFSLNTGKYLIYSSLLVLLFTFWLILLEQFRYFNIFLFLIKVLSSTTLTVSLILAFQFILIRNKPNGVI